MNTPRHLGGGGAPDTDSERSGERQRRRGIGQTSGMQLRWTLLSQHYTSELEDYVAGHFDLTTCPPAESYPYHPHTQDARVSRSMTLVVSRAISELAWVYHIDPWTY